MTIASKCSNPTITIVIATLNVERTLEKCLAGIFNQSYENKEVILIDGESSDGTLNIIKKYEERLSYWESSKDDGIYQAWNKALSHVKGDWIIFLGADDYFYSNTAISKIIPVLEKNKDALLVYGAALLGDSESSIRRGMGWRWEKFKRKMMIPHTAAFHSRRLFEKYGLFDDTYKIAGDYELLLRVGPELAPIYVDETLICMGVDGISKKQKRRALIEWKRAQIKNNSLAAWQAVCWYWWYRISLMMQLQ